MRHRACLPVPTLCSGRLDLPLLGMGHFLSLISHGSLAMSFAGLAWLPVDHEALNALDRQLQSEKPGTIYARCLPTDAKCS